MKTQRPEDDTVEDDDRRWVRRLQADSNAQFFCGLLFGRFCSSVAFLSTHLCSVGKSALHFIISGLHPISSLHVQRYPAEIQRVKADLR